MGTIEIIAGCMFSGKTEELIRRLKRAKIAKQNVIVFKPSIDTRYTKNEICSHNKNTFDSIPVKNSKDILKYINKNTQVVGVEEIQFFDNNIINIIEELKDKGIKIICAGLDMDYKGKPFEITIYLMGIADKVNKLNAICVKCGNVATMSYKLTKDNNRIAVGSSELYEARCRKCWKE